MSKPFDPRPYLSEPLDDDIGAVYALKAMALGTASPEQQQYALTFIVTRLGMKNVMTYSPNDRDTCFAEGRRWVANEIVKRIDVNMDVLKDKPKEKVDVRRRR